MMVNSQRNNSMKVVRLIASFAFAALIAIGCGSVDDEIEGDGAVSFNELGQVINGDPELGAAIEETLNVQVISDISNIPTGSPDSAQITAFITDETNGPVSNAPLTISSDGGLLQNIVAESDPNGEASATLRVINDFRNQSITVQVSTGSGFGSAVVTASGSTVDVAGALNLSVGAETELSARLTSGVGEPIANEVVEISSSAGHEIIVDSAVTNADGVVEFIVSGVSSADTILVSALDGTAVGTANISVVTDLLTLRGVDAGEEIPVGDSTDVIFTWTSSGEPVIGKPLVASLSAGQLLSASSVRTNINGEARFSLTSSSAGPATLSVSPEDGSLETSIDMEFIATIPSKINLESSSSRLTALDTNSILATVTDVNGNPVKNQEVSFASSNLFGGQINPSIATTNSDGKAVVSFTAGSLATQFEAITISAQIVGRSVSDTTQLTVVERVLNVTIGTSNEISERALGTQFAMPYVVQVADGGGAPLEGVTVELSVTPLAYFKGYLELVNEQGLTVFEGDEGWRATRWARDFVGCSSEDANGNRLLDSGEDDNGNGILDPQDPSLLVPIEGTDEFATLQGRSLVTDSRGIGVLELLYPASSALWARVEIVARAQAFGAEREARYQTSLPMLAADITATESTPANFVSPYGTDLDCSNDN